MSQTKIRTTFFTVADKKYEIFVLPYLASVLIHNDDAQVELCLEDPAQFEMDNAKALSILIQSFGDGRLLLRRSEKFADVPTNSIRFIESPRMKLEYVYIGDIDILILESVSRIHIDRMRKTGLPYSNTIQKSSLGKVLSGLHFTRHDFYYPVRIPPNASLNIDRRLLRQLLETRGLPLSDPEDTFRPGHGFHMTLNRIPIQTQLDDIPRWTGSHNPVMLNNYRALCRNPLWRRLVPMFSLQYRTMLTLLNALIKINTQAEIGVPKRID